VAALQVISATASRAHPDVSLLGAPDVDRAQAEMGLAVVYAIEIHDALQRRPLKKPPSGTGPS
jgi:hypothetical protein